MKALTTLLACVAISAAFSQTESTEKPVHFIFKMSPQHLFVNTLKVGGEILNEERTKSFQFMINAIANDKKDDDYYWTTGAPYNGLGAELAYKKYLSPMRELTTRRGRQFLQGIYFSGLIQGGGYTRDFEGSDSFWDSQSQTWVTDYYQYSTKVQNIAVGFTIGLHRIYWKVLSLDAYIGAGYQIHNQTTSGETPEYYYEDYGIIYPNYTGILPKFGLSLGLVL
jgi:hypothetical protein